MHTYRGILSLYALLNTFSNTLNGPYHRDLIFLTRPCSLSLFKCNKTMFPTLNVFLILCWECMALYVYNDLLNASFTFKYILLILLMNFLVLNAPPMVSSIIPHFCAYRTSRGKGGRYLK